MKAFKIVTALHTRKSSRYIFILMPVGLLFAILNQLWSVVAVKLKLYAPLTILSRCFNDSPAVYGATYTSAHKVPSAGLTSKVVKKSLYVSPEIVGKY